MALGLELILRSTAGTVLGLALNSFLASLGKDVLKPIFSQKSFDKLEEAHIIQIYGVKINYGDLLGHLFTLIAAFVSVYAGISVFEMYRVL
jgi:hypothetical protein